jgi:hypothetical protein
MNAINLTQVRSKTLSPTYVYLTIQSFLSQIDQIRNASVQFVNPDQVMTFSFSPGPSPSLLFKNT